MTSLRLIKRAQLISPRYSAIPPAPRWGGNNSMPPTGSCITTPAGNGAACK